MLKSACSATLSPNEDLKEVDLGACSQILATYSSLSTRHSFVLAKV